MKAKRYDEAFKRQAVELMLTGGRSVKEIAADLGVSAFTLYQWKKEHAPPPGGGGGAAPKSMAEVIRENAELRKELEYVRMQRDILKKTAFILGEPPKSTTGGSRR